MSAAVDAMTNTQHPHPDAPPDRGNDAPWRAGVVAFGPPSDPRTFSVIPAAIVQELRRRRSFAFEINAKRFRVADVLGGAVRLKWLGTFPQLGVRATWLWRERTLDRLSARVGRALDAAPAGDVVQIGTTIRVAGPARRHLVYTDMTVRQAYDGGWYGIRSFSKSQLAEAERVQRAVLETAHHVFAISEWTAASLAGDCGVPRERLSVAFSGPTVLDPLEGADPGSGRRILFVGDDWERKGGPLLLEAFDIVRRDYADAELIIVGCTPGSERRGVRELGFLDQRRPEGRRRLVQAFADADVFCLPSRFDAFPITIIEAMQAGLPVVSIDSGSRSEAVQHGQTGLLAPAPTPESLAAALSALLADPELRRGYGRAAHAAAQRRFSWAAIVDRFERAAGAGQG